MTQRERMMAAFHLEEPDHFPIHVRGVPAWDEKWCGSRHESYRPVIEAVAEHGAYEVCSSLGGGNVLSAHPIEATSESEDIGDWIIHHTTIQTPRGPLTLSLIHI